MFSKEVRHFTFQQFTLPTMYKSSNFSTPLRTLIVVCLLNYNHPVTWYLIVDLTVF